MLILLLVATLSSLFGGSPRVMKERVKNTVLDPTRREQATEILDDVHENELANFDAVDDLIDQLTEVHTNYESTPDDYAKVFEGAEIARAKWHSEFLDARAKLHDTLTKDEWEAVFNPKEEEE